MNKNGKLLVFSAPSGSGKTTLVRHLLQKREDLAFSISACTRPARKGEVHGEDYYFMNLEEFKSKIDTNQFVEWEEVYANNFYGTLKEEIERIWSQGKHVIFDIDVIGGLNIKKQFPEKCLTVFVKPPSVAELKNRLLGRNDDSDNKLEERIEKSVLELEKEKDFDVCILNDDLDKAKQEVEQVVSNFLQK